MGWCYEEDERVYREVLHEIIGLGTDLARAVHDQATAQLNTATALAATFDRLARKQILRNVEDAVRRQHEGDECERLDATDRNDDLDHLSRQ